MPEQGNLFKAWGVPPFSVFEPRQDYWRDRKRWWIALGIKSETGRRGDLLFKSQARLNEIQAGKTGGGPAYIDGYRIKEGSKKVPSNKVAGSKPVFRFGYDYDKSKELSQDEVYRLGTSIFDPVLCEMYYRWFSPPGGSVFDPFAGGSVRGICAAAMGRHYTGIELRGEQVEANKAQWEELAAKHPKILGGCPRPRWFEGDSTDCKDIAPGEYDCVFSCPPYYNLEVYCDDPKDLSNMTWEQFCKQYALIIANACSMLREDRFATYVVTELRDDKTGAYRGFLQATIDAFRAAGLLYYNEAVLVTSVGSLPVRVGNQFRSSRKLGRTHQNILTFVKGDPALAAKACSQAEEPIAKRPGKQLAVQGEMFDTPETPQPEPAPVEHLEGEAATPGEQADLFGGDAPEQPSPFSDGVPFEDEGHATSPAPEVGTSPVLPPETAGPQSDGADGEAQEPGSLSGDGGPGEARESNGAPNTEPAPAPTWFGVPETDTGEGQGEAASQAEASPAPPPAPPPAVPVADAEELF